MRKPTDISSQSAFSFPRADCRPVRVRPEMRRLALHLLRKRNLGSLDTSLRIQKNQGCDKEDGILPQLRRVQPAKSRRADVDDRFVGAQF